VSDQIEVRVARPDSWPDVEQVLGHGGSVKGCWCMWFRTTGAERRQMWGDGNRQALAGLVQSGQEPGLVAYLGGEPAGWCSVRPRAEYSALARSTVARPVDESPVWSLVCLYVVPGSRRRGVARELVRAAGEYAASQGGQILEAYPLDDSMRPVSAAAAFHGTVSLLREEGFTEVARHTPTRPVMRRDVSSEVPRWQGSLVP
jgi:GNAT superfamily N-acetyltransferase